MAWVDLASAFAYGSKLTSAQMQNLRDNLAALAAGDSGAPLIQHDALDDAIVDGNNMVYNAGEVRTQNPGTTGAYDEILGADGTWRLVGETYDDT